MMVVLIILINYLLNGIGKKISMTKEQHEELINKIFIPMEKWSGVENAKKILGPNYLRK